MGNSWSQVKLEDVIELNPNRPLSKGTNSPFISMQQITPLDRNITELSRRDFSGSGSRFQNGDTLFARITPCLENGKTAYIKCLNESEVAHGSTEFIVFSGIEGVSDNLFVYYLTRSPGFRNFAIARMEGTSGRQRVPAQVLKEYTFYCPPYDEQQSIAHILGSLDNKIELNKQTNESLEEMARTIFKSWFVDFDPVRAKAEGRDTGLPDEIADLFSDSFEESELGRIPKGWEAMRLGDHIKGQKGVSYKGKFLSEDGIPLHNLNSIFEGGGYKFHGIKFYSGVYKERHLVYPGDVIVANTEQEHKRRLIGYAAIVPDNFGDYGLFSHHLYKVKIKQHSHLTNYFISYLLNSVYMHDKISRYANGTTVNMLPSDSLEKPKSVFPPSLLIQAFTRIVGPMKQQYYKNIGQNQTLSQLRDTLLPKLISGELRVPEAEKITEEYA